MNRGYELENLPAGLERPPNPTRRDEESRTNVDDVLESCLRLLNDLRHKRRVDPVNTFFTLRNLSRQLVALHHYLDAVEVHQHLVVLLRHLRSISRAFESDFAINLASLVSYRNRFQRVTAPGPRCGDPRAVSLPLVPTAHCTVYHVN